MSPSHRATGDEQHLRRGRANSLRLALSGQVGPEALVSEDLRETMALCTSWKGCKRECPTGGVRPRVAADTQIVGLEPSCLLTLRDEFPAMLPGAETEALAEQAQLFEEFVDSERSAGRFTLAFAPMEGRTALLHGHCHQKAFDTVDAAVSALQLIPGLNVETFEATCCGMAGAFGYEAEHHALSLKIGELGVLPKMRAAAPGTLLAANGTSCRHQIADAAGRQARHLVRILDDASAAMGV